MKTKENFADSALFLSPPDNWGSVVEAMKPGAHLLLFNDVRNHHLGAIAVEDHGLEIRDTLAYVFSNGEDGGTAMQLITMARKPLEGTVAENVLRWGTGGINVDACRVATTDVYSYPNGPGGKSHHYSSDKRSSEVRPNPTENNPLGIWPANLLHCGDSRVKDLFPSPHGAGHSRGGGLSKDGGSMFCGNHAGNGMRFGDSGSASRFFYSAPTLNTLVTYLLKLVTPINGTVLTLPQNFDTVCKAAKEEGFTIIMLND